MPPIVFDKQPRIPDAVVAQMSRPSRVSARRWRAMSPAQRERTLVEHAFERRGDTWVQRDGGDELADQVVAAATQIAGAQTVGEIIIGGAMEDVVQDDRLSDQQRDIFATVIVFLVGLALLLLLVLGGYGLGAWLDGRNGEQTTESPSDSAASASTSVTSTTTTTTIVVAAADPGAGGPASTSTTSTTTTTSSTTIPSTKPASTTTVPPAIVVAVSADDVVHDARFLANLDAINLEASGVAGRWFSPWFEQSQQAGGSITLDPDGRTFSVALTEIWTCDGGCPDTFDSSTAVLTAAGSGELRPDGAGWLIEGTVTVDYSAQFGEVESPSTCAGEPCYTCADRYCRWDSSATESVPITGRVEGTTARIAFVDGLAEDIAAMDFTDLRTTEFFMSRYEHVWDLPTPVDAP